MSTLLNLSTSLAKHVRMFLWLNVPMAVFNKLRNIREICLRVEIIFTFSGQEFYQICPAMWVVIDFKIQASCKHISRRVRWSSWNTLVKYNQRVYWKTIQNYPIMCVKDIKMKCSISNTCMKHFVGPLIGHAVHVDPLKKLPTGL